MHIKYLTFVLTILCGTAQNQIMSMEPAAAPEGLAITTPEQLAKLLQDPKILDRTAHILNLSGLNLTRLAKRALVALWMDKWLRIDHFNLSNNPNLTKVPKKILYCPCFDALEEFDIRHTSIGVFPEKPYREEVPALGEESKPRFLLDPTR